VEASEARELFAASRVARLATSDVEGRPHLVPITFALEDDVIVTAVDHKPKRTTRLRRITNIAANPWVSALVDHYEEDWSSLWWVRADGVARVVEPASPQHAGAMAQLAERYDRYRERAPEGPAIAITVSRWSGWRATPSR
jgi:PPOX class probable F420-dependent enzyme